MKAFLFFILKWLDNGRGLASNILQWFLSVLINPFLPMGSPLMGSPDVTLSMWSGLMHEYGKEFWLSDFVKFITELFDDNHVQEAIETGKYREKVKFKAKTFDMY